MTGNKKEKTATLLGLLRDAVSAILGLLILFGVDFSSDQIAGILLVVTTLSALGAWIYIQRTGG